MRNLQIVFHVIFADRRVLTLDSMLLQQLPVVLVDFTNTVTRHVVHLTTDALHWGLGCFSQVRLTLPFQVSQSLLQTLLTHLIQISHLPPTLKIHSIKVGDYTWFWVFKSPPRKWIKVHVHASIILSSIICWCIEKFFCKLLINEKLAKSCDICTVLLLIYKNIFFWKQIRLSIQSFSCT